MKKKLIPLLCGMICAIIGVGIYYNLQNNDMNGTINNENNESLVTNTDNNNKIIKTNSNSTIRVINYYDEDMFKEKNTILFIWASWCPHCATEFDELNEILKKYKNDKDVNIVFIAHEYKQEDGNIDNLLELLEGGTVDFDTEILLDYGRVIRKHIDPEEGYVPRTYFLDKDCNVLEEIEDTVTVEQIDNLINKYYK